MIRQCYSTSGRLAFIVAAIFAAFAPLASSARVLAQADQLYDSTGYWRYYNGNWYHYRSSIHGASVGYYARPDRVLPHGVSPLHFGAYPSRPTPVEKRGATYGRLPTGETSSRPPLASVPVRVDVSLPADAEFWFFETKTAQTGTVRRFVSPPLIPGYNYTYEIRARWKENGREVTQSRRITVRAGDHVSVAFPVPSGSKAR